MRKLFLCFALIPLLIACDAKNFATSSATSEESSTTAAKGDATETTVAKSPGEQITAMTDEFEAKMDRFQAAIEEATGAERQTVFRELYPKPEDYIGPLMEIARENPDDPAAVDALVWVASHSRGGKAYDDAMDTLVEKHTTSERLSEVCIGLMRSRSSTAEKKLQKLIDESPHDKVQGAATFALASLLKTNSEKDEAITEDQYLPLLKKVSMDYGDVDLAGRKLGDMANGAIFEIEHLSIGKEAPDIEGEDLDGVAFKLSDYRGKVIMLDFWGDW